MTPNPDEDPGLERACRVPGEPVPPSHSFLREPTAILTHGVVTLSDLRLQESENSRSEVLKQACKWGRNTAGPGVAEDGRIAPAVAHAQRRRKPRLAGLNNHDNKDSHLGARHRARR